MNRKIGALFLACLLACANSSAARIPMRRGIWSHPQERRAPQAMAETLRRDLSRDRITPERILPRDRFVDRYTRLSRSRAEARIGLSAGTHLTSRVRRGHPMSAQTVQERYGLPKLPQVRERILLKRGTSVKFNKALGGKPGVGELTVVKPASRTVLKNVRRIR
jgi:hypothetical protein